MNALSCLLCGHEGYDVGMSLVRWREPEEGGNTYDFIPRCKERGACRGRVEALGEAWPVADAGESRAA